MEIRNRGKRMKNVLLNQEIDQTVWSLGMHSQPSLRLLLANRRRHWSREETIKSMAPWNKKEFLVDWCPAIESNHPSLYKIAPSSNSHCMNDLTNGSAYVYSVNRAREKFLVNTEWTMRINIFKLNDHNSPQRWTL